MTATEVEATAARPLRTVVTNIREGDLRYTSAVVVLFLLLIQGLSYVFPRFIFPDLPAIASGLADIYRQGLGDIQASAIRYVLALGCASVVGWALGLLMGLSRSVGRYGEAFFKVIMSVPALSWILLVVLWFRTIELRVFFVVFVLALPFYVVGVYEAIRGLDKEQVEAVQQFRPSRLQRFRLLLMPATHPTMITTTKQVSGLVMRMLIFAELIGATSGIGYAMAQAQSNFRINMIFAWTIVLVIVNFLLFRALAWVEGRALKWRPDHAT